jgi:hypothetical protein
MNDDKYKIIPLPNDDDDENDDDDIFYPYDDDDYLPTIEW